MMSQKTKCRILERISKYDIPEQLRKNILFLIENVEGIQYVQTLINKESEGKYLVVFEVSDYGNIKKYDFIMHLTSDANKNMVLEYKENYRDGSMDYAAEDILSKGNMNDMLEFILSKQNQSVNGGFQYPIFGTLQ